MAIRKREITGSFYLISGAPAAGKQVFWTLTENDHTLGGSIQRFEEITVLDSNGSIPSGFFLWCNNDGFKKAPIQCKEPDGSVWYFVMDYADGTPINKDELRAAGEIVTQTITLSGLVDQLIDQKAVSYVKNQNLTPQDQAIVRLNIGKKPLSLSLPNPTANEDIYLLKLPFDITVQKITSVLQGAGGPSLTWSLRFDADRSAPGTELVNGGVITNSTTLGIETISIDNPTIPADSYLKLVTTAKSGTVTELGLTIYYI